MECTLGPYRFFPLPLLTSSVISVEPFLWISAPAAIQRYLGFCLPVLIHPRDGEPLKVVVLRLYLGLSSGNWGRESL